VQALYKIGLEPVTEERTASLYQHSYGFRPGRSAAMAAHAAHFHIANPRTKPTHAIELDIKSCFDTISHDYMLKNIPMDKHILKSWLKQGFINKDKKLGTGFNPTDEGIPQGGIISPLLCNFTLEGMDIFIREKLHQKITEGSITITQLGYVRYRASLKLLTVYRYADDMLILIKSETTYVLILPLIIEFLQVRGLKICGIKTKLTDLRAPSANLDFVGYCILRTQHFNKIKWFIIPTKKNEAKVREKLVSCMKKASTPRNLFFKSNEIIRGWTNYYITVNAKSSFKKLSWYLGGKFFYYLFGIIAKSKKYRNKRKPKRRRIYRTIIRRYKGIHVVGKSKMKWFIFRDPRAPKRRRTIPLVNPLQLRLSKHVPLFKQGLNYFHPIDRTALININLSYQTGFRREVFKKSKWTCKCCNVCLIGSGLQADIHHILPIYLGGKNDLKNTTVLCKPCHIKVHSLSLNINPNKAPSPELQELLDADIIKLT
jgi:RNA-directed DNA polymerase